MLKDLGQVGVWLSGAGLEASLFDQERVSAFLAARRASGRRRIPGPRAMAPLQSYLREAGVVTAEQPSVTPLAALLGQYRSWMIHERGLAAMTVLRYENTARRFLQEQALADEVSHPPR